MKPEVADAYVAVVNYKHALLVKVQRVILEKAARQPFVSANDVPRELLDEAHHQGVYSNAWNGLSGLKNPILEKLPLSFNDSSRNIFAGRTKSVHASRKGGWNAVYRLASKKAMETWMERNLEPEPASLEINAPVPDKQEELSFT